MSDDHGAIHYTERMVPEEAHARIFWEHVARYRFAKDFVRGKRVLDIACGEGYGAAALAKAGAASVVGIDVSPDVCEHARRKYGLDARTGDAQAIPLPDRSIDVVVSFETIEHVDDPAAFCAECARVLVPDGTLIVSTPNRPVYSGEGPTEPVPSVEFDEEEFVDLLRSRFQCRSALHPVPPVGRLVELPLARGRTIALAPHQGILADVVLVLPRDPNPRQPGDPATADEIILARDSFPSSLFNPYIVRPLSKRAANGLISSSRWPRASRIASKSHAGAPS